MTFNTFAAYARALGTEVDKSAFDKLEVYFSLLIEWNQKFNLTAITDRDEVFVKHFLDSAAGAKYIPHGASVCDIGTGAGFPGLVLKIIRPDLTVTLIDSLAKRLNFLEAVTDAVGVTAPRIHMRAEDAGRNPQYRDRFQVVVSRALAKLNTLYEYALPLVKPHGIFLGYKAHCEQELTDSRLVPQKLNAILTDSHSFRLPPNDDYRMLVVATKLSKTPAEYPRGKNKERALPLK